MDGRRRDRAWLAWCVGVALFALSGLAQAAVSAESVPRGFVEPATDEAIDRSDVWALAVGGAAVQVYSTEGNDGFSETLALIEIDGPIPDGGDSDPGAVLLQIAGRALGQTEVPADARVDFDDEGNLGVLTGTWASEDLGETYYVAMASGGPTHALVVMAIKTDEASLYQRGFDEVLGGLEGIAPPLARFNQARWRVWGVVCWLLFGVGAWVVVWRVGHDDSATEQAKKVALACIAAVFLVAIVAWFALGNSGSELALAGLSRPWAVAELAFTGVGIATLALVAGAIRSSQVQPIQSAPDEGTFGRLHQRGPRSVPARQQTVSGKIDGPGNLTPAAEDISEDAKTLLSLVPVEGKIADEPGAPQDEPVVDNTLVGVYPPPTKPGPPPRK